MTDNEKQQAPQPPPKPKRSAGSTPPPRPEREVGSQPPPIPPRRDERKSSGGKSEISKRVLILIGAGVLCLILLASFFDVFGPTSTTAADYTSAEVREIFRLLDKDPACRDTRLGDAFAEDRISLELLDAVLGLPVTKAGSYPHLVWTYRTSDGTATITPFAVYEEEGQIPGGGPPFLEMQGSVQIVGLDSNKSVDRERLKRTILSIKSRFDDGNGEEFAEQLAAQRQKEREAEAAVFRKRDEQEQKEREEFNARLQKEREAEIARREEQRRQREAELGVKKLALEIQRQAEREYYDLLDSLPVGEAKEAFQEQGRDWRDRRIQKLQTARERELDWKNAPLPSTETVVAALERETVIPIEPTVSENPKTSPDALDSRTYWKTTKGGYYEKLDDGTWMERWPRGKDWGPFEHVKSTQEYVEITRQSGNCIVRLYEDRAEVRFVSLKEDFRKLYDGEWSDLK